MPVIAWSLVAVFLAEMADKTQLLVLAFAARYPARSVLAGVFVATVANHALAVGLGSWLAAAADVSVVRSLAAASFVLFGLWTLRGDGGEADVAEQTRFGPIVTVAIAFFVAEMGDKTQLAAGALAARYQEPLLVLAGTVTAMLGAAALAVYVGAAVGKRLPERAVRWAAALLFIGFGFVGLYTWVPEQCVTLPRAAAVVVATALGAWLAARRGKSVSGRNSLKS